MFFRFWKMLTSHSKGFFSCEKLMASPRYLDSSGLFTLEVVWRSLNTRDSSSVWHYWRSLLDVRGSFFKKQKDVHFLFAQALQTTMTWVTENIHRHSQAALYLILPLYHKLWEPIHCQSNRLFLSIIYRENTHYYSVILNIFIKPHSLLC